ncbi:uncharacterized protein LOC111637720 [Centruroides sculpturatus]|uniref:uncharacterized protein LOC111637720 n=1 Tax=Centruroides sculpturatus TaxID=218467 RepID=UPI000C6E2408|nr:uncharacterized protein LOC111637720 [Centruroides sculpturatus]
MAASIAVIIITFLPLEKSRKYCGSLYYLIGNDPLMTKAFSLTPMITTILMNSDYFYKFLIDFKMKIEEKYPPEEEIISVLENQAKYLYLCLCSIIFSSVSQYILLMTEGFKRIAVDGEELAAKCLTYINLGISFICGEAHLGGAITIIYFFLIKDRWIRLLNECRSFHGRKEDFEKFVEYSQRRFEDLALYVEELKKAFTFIGIVLNMLTVGFIATIAFILKYSRPDVISIGVLFIVLCTMTIASFRILFAAAEFPYQATEVMKEVSRFRLYNLSYEKNLRLLNFMKRMGGTPIGFEIFDVIVTRICAFKLMESIFSFFSTLGELYGLAYKNKRLCKTEKGLNSTL